MNQAEDCPPPPPCAVWIPIPSAVPLSIPISGSDTPSSGSKPVPTQTPQEQAEVNPEQLHRYDDTQTTPQLPNNSSPPLHPVTPRLPSHLRERWIVADKENAAPEPIKPIRLQRDVDGSYKVMQPSIDAAMMTPMMNAYPLSQAARLSPINTFPSTMMNPPWYNPVMYNNVAYPTMLPHNMMPQQHQYQQNSFVANPNMLPFLMPQQNQLS